MGTEGFKDMGEDYKAGYEACEKGIPYDNTKNELWKQGYRDKEIELGPDE